MEVKVIDNDVEKALKILKNKLSKSGLFKELKVRRAYEKPSVKRKEKPSKRAADWQKFSAAAATNGKKWKINTSSMNCPRKNRGGSSASWRSLWIRLRTFPKFTTA